MSNKKFTGAGVVIVENYHTAANRVIPSILVVKIRSSGKLSDFGGGLEKKHKNLSDTAATELREESRGLIDISADILTSAPTVDIVAMHYPDDSDKNEYYRAYLIKADGVPSKYFNINKEILDSDVRTKKYMKETESIHHIPIKDIDFSSLTERGTVVMIDVHGVPNVASMRLRKILSSAKNLIDSLLKTEPVITKNNLEKINDMYVFKKY